MELFGGIATAALLALATASPAATLAEVMASRYMKYNFCMQSALGQEWRVKHKVPFGMNRWGVSEPTDTGIIGAGAGIQKRDASCRQQNAIADEPRPSYEYPEKNKPD